MTTPQPCAGGCGTMLRPYGARIADYPDTQLVRRAGRCGKCADEVPPATRIRHRPDHCVECQQPMRARRVTREQEPDTVRYGAHGRCVSCLQTLYKNHDGPPPDPLKATGIRELRIAVTEDHPEYGSTVAGLKAYLRGRQQRKAAHGL